MVPKQRVYGHQQPNGSWTGLIGLLQRQEVDFAGTMFALTPGRLATLDFSEPLYIDEYNSIYIRPGVTPDMASFIKPYNPLVWVSVFVATLLVFTACQAVLRGTDFLNKQGRAKLSVTQDWRSAEDSGLRGRKKAPEGVERTDGGEEHLKEVETSAVWIWGILLSQSVPWMPSKDLGRSVAALWLLMAFTLGSVYRSNLKAMIIYPRIHLPFSTLDELQRTDIPTIIFNGSQIHKHIMDADNSSSLGGLRDQLDLYYNDQLALVIQQLVKGNGACVSFTMGILYVMDRTFSQVGKCTFYKMSRGFLGPLSLSMAFPKGSTLKIKFDDVITRLREAGIMPKLFREGQMNATKCATTENLFLAEVKERPLHLKDFYGVFLVYGGGLLLAAGVFLSEVFRGTRRPSRAKPPALQRAISQT
ncbi:glutamate receptor 1-like [Portunus trituberculatus]|uniref:glutamate receptor 1-like n=1 Tax=Portunus trituberculatus TaxID=210409 RepID=UPI001E1D1B9D|nr:glutamate receptor 1-like [Portunus trituberculatus]